MVSEVVDEASDSGILVELVGRFVGHAMIGTEFLFRRFESRPSSVALSALKIFRKFYGNF